MPVVVVATLTAKPESVDTVRDILTRAVDDVHREPGCQLYALHETGETFIFVEQWADAEALKAHSGAPAVATMFTAAGEHLVGAPDIKLLQPVPAGDPSKGQLRRRSTGHSKARSPSSPAPRAAWAAHTRFDWQPTARTSSRLTSASRSPACLIR